MNEVNSLLERADKYLRSARILLEEGDYESSVSRTYYAMFYSAQAMLLTLAVSSRRSFRHVPTQPVQTELLRPSTRAGDRF